MKSMLHEASSIAKAIEKAWTDAGKPTDFTIKVLEAGEKNFLGLSKRPAIVSITYEPRKQITRQQDSGKNQDRRTPPVQRESLKPAQVKPVQVKPVQPKVAQPKEVVKEKRDIDQGELLVWQEEMVVFVAKELKELLKLWGAVPEFSSKIDKRALIITLDGKLHDDAMEERNVFMSFSYLLVQLLKRHYKKKFRGFQLIITAKKNA